MVVSVEREKSIKEIRQELTMIIGDAYLMDYPHAERMIVDTAIYQSLVSSDTSRYQEWDYDALAALVWGEIVESQEM